jgi:hypothetical protein
MSKLLQDLSNRKGGRQCKSCSTFGLLILEAMRLFDLSYQDIVVGSRRLAMRYGNPDMRIAKSTLGDIVSGSIRQPSGPKLDSLRIILRLSRSEMDQALGLKPERRLSEQLEIKSPRTYEVSFDAVTRQRELTVPILRTNADLSDSRFFDSLIADWVSVEVEYLAAFYPPHLIYAIVGEADTFASPVAPPGTRLLVNTFLTEIGPADNTSFYLRPLFFVRTSKGFTCSYLEETHAGKVVLVPHPGSGHVRRELPAGELKIIGQVVGLLFPGER